MSPPPTRSDDTSALASDDRVGAGESDHLNLTVPTSTTTTTSLMPPERALVKMTLDGLDIVGEQTAPTLLQIGMTYSEGPPVGNNKIVTEETQVPIKGLEVIDEDNVPPPCIAEIEAVAASQKKLEVIQDDNNPPEPFNFQWMEDGSYDIESIKKVKPSRPLVVEEEIAVDSAGDSTALNVDSRQLRIDPSQFNEVYVDTALNIDSRQLRSAPSQFNEVHVDTDIDLEVTEGVSLDQETIINERADSPIHIPEAFLVEETGSEDIVIATILKPPRPWWRQRRVQLLLVIVLFVVMGFAIYIGDSRKKARLASLESFPPTTFPSSSPTTCARTLTSRNITSTDDIIMHDLRFEADGTNLVLVVQDGSITDGRPLYALFFSLINSLWQQVQTIEIQADGYLHNVALSGSTVFIGIVNENTNEGNVVVYEKYDEEWKKVDEAFDQTVDSSYYSAFGIEVVIDGDFAAVGTWDDKVLVYSRDNGKWTQIDEVEGECPCSIDGDVFSLKRWDYDLSDWVLGLYRRSEERDMLNLIQAPFQAGNPFLSGAYLAYWDIDEISDGSVAGTRGDGKWDLYMYHQDGANMTYIFQNRFNMTGGNGALSFDNDILVVGGDDSTHIFTLAGDDNWEETITLDEAYDKYHVSGHYLFALKASSLHSINIEDCVETELLSVVTSTPPTDSSSTAPSLTIYPSVSPSEVWSSNPSVSFHPSMSPSVSMSPSSSSSPTETCYWVNITVVYDINPWENVWYLQRVVVGQVLLVTWNTGHYGKLNDTKSMCLQEGEYRFTIGDLFSDGICCEYGFGHYYVTSSNDVLVTEGGIFESESTTSFALPFIKGASSTPSSQSLELLSPSPSSVSPSPISWSPSISQSPTEICYQVEITVDFGAHYSESTHYFVLRQTVDFGDDIDIFSSDGASMVDFVVRSGQCLQAGMYLFVFQCPYMEGHYNITTSDDGALIANGSGLFFYDSTLFSIPFVPAEYV